MLQVVLNTQIYFGGEPYNMEGSPLYQLPKWSKDAKLTSINFFRDEGDAGRTRIDIYDGIQDEPVYSEEVTFRALYSCDVPIHSIKDRLLLKLTALDGDKDNHAKLVIRGEEIEAMIGEEDE